MDSGTKQYAGVFKNVFFPGSLLECGVWFCDAAGMWSVAARGGERSCRVL